MSAPIVPGHTADDNQAWLNQVPLETLECRTLRHQWPRMARDKRTRHKLPASGPVVWRSLRAGEAGRLVEREMTCLAGCGTVRTELFLVRRDGRMIRDGTPATGTGRSICADGPTRMSHRWPRSTRRTSWVPSSAASTRNCAGDRTRQWLPRLR